MTLGRLIILERWRGTLNPYFSTGTFCRDSGSNLFGYPGTCEESLCHLSLPFPETFFRWLRIRLLPSCACVVIAIPKASTKWVVVVFQHGHMVHEHKRLNSIMLVHPEFAVSCGHCLFALFWHAFSLCRDASFQPHPFSRQNGERCAPLRSWVGPTPPGKFHRGLNMIKPCILCRFCFQVAKQSKDLIRGLGNGGRAEFIQMLFRLFWYGRSGQNPGSLFFLRVTLPSKDISDWF